MKRTPKIIVLLLAVMAFLAVIFVAIAGLFKSSTDYLGGKNNE